MGSTPFSDVDKLQRRMRRVRVAVLGTTFVLIVLPGAVSIYVLQQKRFLSPADREKIATSLAPQVSQAVTTSFQHEMKTATARQDAKLSELDGRMSNAEAISSLLPQVSANTRTIQQLSNDVGRSIEASSSLQKQAAQMERQIQETRALNESAFNEMKRQGSSIAQSMSETNAVIASLQQNLIEVKSDLSSLQNTQRQQQEELNKLDARLRKVELQMDVHEGWLRHLWGRMTGKGQAKSTE